MHNVLIISYIAFSIGNLFILPEPEKGSAVSLSGCRIPGRGGYSTSQVAPERSRSSTQWILLAALTSSTCFSTARS